MSSCSCSCMTIAYSRDPHDAMREAAQYGMRPIYCALRLLQHHAPGGIDREERLGVLGEGPRRHGGAHDEFAFAPRDMRLGEVALKHATPHAYRPDVAPFGGPRRGQA